MEQHSARCAITTVGVAMLPSAGSGSGGRQRRNGCKRWRQAAGAGGGGTRRWQLRQETETSEGEGRFLFHALSLGNHAPHGMTGGVVLRWGAEVRERGACGSGKTRTEARPEDR